MEELIKKQIAMMLADLENEKSDLYNFVFRYSMKTKEEFTKQLANRIEAVNHSHWYGMHGDDELYAAYKTINGTNVYFKFTAPKDEMKQAVGSGAPFLEMFRGGVYLYELGPVLLEKFVMPSYYRGIIRYFESLAGHPSVKAWHTFNVSLD